MKRTRWLLKKYGLPALLGVALVLVLVWQLSEHEDQPKEMALTEMLARSGRHQVEKAEIDSDDRRVTALLENGARYIANYPAEYDDELTTKLQKHGVEIRAVHTSFWDEYGRDFVFFGGVGLLLFGPFLFAKLRATHQARSKQVTSVPSERFDDVKGADETIEELGQLVDFLKDPARYDEAGVRPPRGWLLYGPPGTGKTLLARAVAGEAGVPFFYVTGSEFAVKYIGEGAATVRALFDRARTVSYDTPVIVFIDELDAIGAERGDGGGDGELEHSVTLNQLLTEMDGFLTKDSHVIVMGATNRLDALDPALLRPGRLTRQVAMPAPDIAAREAMLRSYASRLAYLDPHVDFATLARITSGLAGADLAETCNAAGLLALRQDSPTVTTAHFKEVLATAAMGHARPSAEVAEEDRQLTAVHEGGHALVAFLSPKASKPHQVTIVPRGQSAGATWMLGDDRLHFTADNVRDELAVALAGRAAERLVLGERGFAAAGAADDRAKATDLALRAVCEWGIGTLDGYVDVDGWRSDPRAEVIAREVDRLVREAERKATELLTEHRGALDALIDRLLAVETISGEDVEALATA